jgi:hypothetical protein
MMESGRDKKLVNPVSMTALTVISGEPISPTATLMVASQYIIDDPKHHIDCLRLRLPNRKTER